VALGGGEAGGCVHGHGPPAPAGKQPGPAGDPQGLGGVREVEAGDGGDLQAADLDPAVAAVAAVVLGRDVAPGQVSQLVVQVGWLAFTISR
jgi:hypothetical protein